MLIRFLDKSSLEMKVDDLVESFENLSIQGLSFHDCRFSTDPIQKKIMEIRYNSKVEELFSLYEGDVRSLARLRSCSMKGSGAFSHAVPNENLGTKMYNREFQFAVAYRIGLPVNLSKNYCSMLNCSKIVDKFGDHALLCGYGGDRIYRHNALRDTIFHMLRKVGYDAKLEKRGLLSDSDEKPGDIFVHTFDSGRPEALDVTVSSSVQPSSIQNASEETGFVVNAAESRKDRKFYDKCRAQGIDFFPLAVESLGG